MQDDYTSYTVIKLTQYAVPEAEVFKLLGEMESNKGKINKVAARPVSHIKSRVTFTIMTDNVMLPMYSMPLELMNHIKYIHRFIKQY